MEPRQGWAPEAPSAVLIRLWTPPYSDFSALSDFRLGNVVSRFHNRAVMACWEITPILDTPKVYHPNKFYIWEVCNRTRMYFLLIDGEFRVIATRPGTLAADVFGILTAQRQHRILQWLHFWGVRYVIFKGCSCSISAGVNDRIPMSALYTFGAVSR